MIDLSRSRRGSFLKCVYWKRDLNETIDNNQLILKKVPEGVFYAKYITEKDIGQDNVANSMLVKYESVTIQTEDKVNIEANDLVFMNNGKWIVTGVRETEIQKNAEFSINTSKITNITMRKE